MKIYKNKPVIFFQNGGGGGHPVRRSWIRLCSISLTCIIFLSLFIYSSLTVLISLSLLFEPSMTSGMSEASSNYILQRLTPLTDYLGPPYDKYHITQLSPAKQAHYCIYSSICAACQSYACFESWRSSILKYHHQQEYRVPHLCQSVMEYNTGP